MNRVDVAAWGATLVSRRAVELAGAPDSAWFFGFEDFDFFLRFRAAGLAVLVDTECREAQERVFFEGRQSAIGNSRPRDDQEPWRQYYFARNFFELARRHGNPSWTAWHLLYSARRLQLMVSGEPRRAYLRGLVDGARGRMGRNDRFLRETGEW